MKNVLTILKHDVHPIVREGVALNVSYFFRYSILDKIRGKVHVGLNYYYNIISLDMLLVLKKGGRGSRK